MVPRGVGRAARALRLAVGLVTMAGLVATCSRAEDEYSGGCPADPKTCGDRCVAVDDPAFGCTREGCDPCDLANASAKCQGATCVVAECAPLSGDCDGVSENGCEVDLGQTVEHCGGCDAPCAGHALLSCVGGACVVEQCDAGFGDCDDDGRNGCETELTTSDEHCGRCGASCGGGACTAGRCEAVVLFEGPDEAFQPLGIAVDETHVYWANWRGGGAGRVYRVAKDSEMATAGDAEVVATALASPFGVAVDETHVYWSAWGTGAGPSQGVFRGPKGGVTTPEALPGAFTAPSGLSLRGRTLYWTNLGVLGNNPAANGIWRIDLDGAPLQPELFHVDCADCAAILDVAADDAMTYWTVFRGELDGGALQAKSSAVGEVELVRGFESFPSFIATDAASVYWTRSGVGGGLWRSDRSLSNAEELLAGLNGPTGVAVDAERVYVGEQNTRRIYRMTKPQ